MIRDFDLLHNIEEGKHLYQFYKDSEDYFSALIPYFKSGLEKGDACLWLVSKKNGMNEARERAKQMIENFEKFEKRGQIQILSAEEWYLEKGSFDEKQSLEKAKEAVKVAIDSGFTRVRASGDVAAIPLTERSLLKSYEAKIHETISGSPVIALCAYPILDCSLQETKQVIDQHNDVLIGNL